MRKSQFVTWHSQHFNCYSGCPSLCGLSELPVPLTHLYSNIYLSVFFNLLVCRLLNILEGGLCLSRGKLSLLGKKLALISYFSQTQVVFEAWDWPTRVEIPWCTNRGTVCLLPEGCFQWPQIWHTSPPLLNTFMIIRGWWNRLCHISYCISQRSPCSWCFLSVVGRWVLFLVPPKPFSVPEAEPVAFTNLTVPVPSSIPVFIPCLITLLENRITLNKPKRIQENTL